MKDLIRKHALLNAVQYNAKANEGAVLGKVLAEDPNLKNNIEVVKAEVRRIVSEINTIPLAEQQELLEKYGEIKKPEKVERKGLPELPNAEMGKVTTRFAPEPNGPLHFGHLKAAFLSYLYAKKYKGRFIVRYEDTNPEREKKEYYGAIRKDLKDFGIKFNKEVKESSFMEEFYKYAEQLIKEGHFFVCSCPQDKIKRLRAEGIGCMHRTVPTEKHLKLWEYMLKDAEEGEMIVRLKTDPKHINPALRDPSMFRIVETPHPLLGKKYRVYPLYNFANVISDHKLKVTHVLRDKGFENDAKVQEILYQLLGWEVPTTIQFGRIKSVAGIPMKKRKILEMINQGKLKGFDDLRIPNPRNLLKRGFRPEAIKRLIEEIGPSKVDIDINFDTLETYNRQLIDPVSERFFFVAEPVEITLDRVPAKSAKAPILPGKRKYRKIPVTKKINVEKIDFTQFRKREVRLMHLANVILDRQAKVTGKTVKDIPKIHWVSSKNVKIKVFMPNGKEIEGLAEPGIINLNTNDTVQFVRIGFARVDKIDKKKKRVELYFAHP